MTWILIGLVLVVAFGPILWLVPSKRDKRLAAMRARARSEGLLVEMRRIPKPDPRPEDRVSSGGRVRNPVIECASYSQPLQRGLKFLPGWRLIRKPASEAADPFPDWQYDVRPEGEGRAYLPEMLEVAPDCLKRLPADVVAIEVAPRMVLAYWLERPGTNADTVSDLAVVLREFQDALSGLDARIEAKLDDKES